MSPFMILALLIVLLIIFVIFTYNKMIKMRNRVNEAWSDIDVQLKRRYNLIPNIVETVKGYATHEDAVFTKVTEARSNAINATNMKDQGVAENMLSGALKSLFAVAENYPELKANENFMQLQTELVDTEDKIQAARRFHNTVVRDFNTKIQSFPNSIVAKMFKFQDREFFEAEEDEKENVEVSFDKDKGEAPEAAAAAPAPEAPAPEAPAEEPAPEPAAPAAPAEEEKEETSAEPTPAPMAEAPAEEEKAEESAPAEPTPTPEPEAPAPETPAAPEPTPEAPAAPEAPAEPAPEEEKPEEEKPAEPTT